MANIEQENLPILLEGREDEIDKKARELACGLANDAFAVSEARNVIVHDMLGRIAFYDKREALLKRRSENI